MIKKILAGVIIIAVLGLGTWYALGEPGMVTPQEKLISWKFENTTTVGGAPQTSVSLVYNGTVREVATYQGICTELSTQEIAKGAISGALCWSGTRGDGIEVFEENGKYIVKHIAIDGTEVSQDFETLFSLE